MPLYEYFSTWLRTTYANKRQLINNDYTKNVEVNRNESTINRHGNEQAMYGSNQYMIGNGGDQYSNRNGDKYGESRYDHNAKINYNSNSNYNGNVNEQSMYGSSQNMNNNGGNQSSNRTTNNNNDYYRNRNDSNNNMNYNRGNTTSSNDGVNEKKRRNEEKLQKMKDDGYTLANEKYGINITPRQKLYVINNNNLAYPYNATQVRCNTCYDPSDKSDQPRFKSDTGCRFLCGYKKCFICKLYGHASDQCHQKL